MAIFNTYVTNYQRVIWDPLSNGVPTCSNDFRRRCGGAAVVSDHDQSDQFLPQRL